MRRVLGSLLGVAGVIGMVAIAGCGLLGPTEDEISVSISNGSVIDTITQSGTSVAIAQVEGEVKANGTPVSLVISLTRVGGGSTSGIKVTNSPVPQDKETIRIGTGKDMTISIEVEPTACRGTYTLSIKGSYNEKSNIATQTIQVLGATDCSTPAGTPTVVSGTLIAGSNSNPTYGSSIDLDGPNVWKSAEAATNVAKIDLVYAYSGVASKDRLFSPHHAKASEFNFAINWANPNQIKFYKTSLTSAQYAAISTKEEIAALWSEPSAAGTSVDAVANDVFIAKTSENAIALLHIEAQTPGAAGTISFKVAK